MTVTIQRAAASIPPLTGSCRDLLAMAGQPDTEVHDVIHIAEFDQRITLELLRLANSAYFARGTRVTTIRDAIVRIGTVEALRASIAIAMTSLFSGRTSAISDAEILDASIRLARAWGDAAGATSSVAGTLMPLGLLVLERVKPTAFARMVAAVGCMADFDDLHAYERGAFGVSRCEAMEEVAGVWDLPEALAQVFRTWHVCHGAETPQFAATVAIAHTFDSPFLQAVTIR